MGLVEACAANKTHSAKHKVCKWRIGSNCSFWQRSGDECLPSPAVLHIGPVFHLWWMWANVQQKIQSKASSSEPSSFIHRLIYRISSASQRVLLKDIRAVYVLEAGMFIPGKSDSNINISFYIFKFFNIFWKKWVCPCKTL